MVISKGTCSLMKRTDCRHVSGTKKPKKATNAAKNSEPHIVATYLRELAGDFHAWYNAHKTLVDDPTLRDARLALSEAVRQVIANGLDILGVSAPQSM